MKTLYLLLGNNCNANCKYCMQTNNKHKFTNIYFKNETLDYVIKHLDRYNRIVFWGGEPLLYWDEIKRIIDYLGGKIPHLKYTSVSNGILLNEEIVEYINEYDFDMAFSHDGPNTKITRGFDIFENENFVKNFNNIKSNNRYIQSVFSSYTQSLSLMDEYYQNINAKIRIMLLRCYFKDMPEDLYNFDYNFIREQIHQIFKYDKNYLFKKKFSRAVLDSIKGIYDFYLKDKNPLHRMVCGFNVNDHLDGNGNFYVCHESLDNKIGTIYDNYEDIKNNYEIELKKLINKNKSLCNKCDVYNICKCDCLQLNETYEGNKATCKILNIMYNEAQYFHKNNIMKAIDL